MNKQLFNILSSVALTFVPLLTSGQAEKGMLRADQQPGGIIEAKPITIGKAKGSMYYMPQWSDGSIRMSDDRILKNQLVKYNISEQNIELKTSVQDKILMLLNSDILEFEITDSLGNAHKFINVLEAGGFVEILYESDDIKLLNKMTTKILKSNYNAALDVGSKNDKIVLVEELYIFKNMSILKLPGNRKQFFQIFHPNHQEIKSFVKTENLSIKNKEHLKQIFLFYNTLE